VKGEASAALSKFTTVKQPLRHCERSEAIQNASAAAVWIASSLTLLAMTVRDITPHSRGAFCVRVMHRSRPSKVRGRRECRALDAPVAACAVVESTRVSHHRHTGTTRHSLRNGLRLMFALSPVSGLFLATVVCWLVTRKLDPSVGRSGPRVFAVRVGVARPAPPTRPSHPAPNVRDDREPPL
jgi:hypothetical protein